ncbi:MAG TPA: tellurite resistance protein permease, partial [Nocardioidaceae bacterium]|nr:tellurite resistance protein permease [Nocardioidaceae bacterium]
MVDTFSGRLRQAVHWLTPGYFALVMATGIISLGLMLEGFDVLSLVMLWLCGIAFMMLVWLTVWRFVSFRHLVVEDFTDPA